MNLNEQHCRPCKGEVAPLNVNESEEFLKEVPGWNLSADGKGLFSLFEMKNFLKAVDLISRIARLAEEEGHHPDIHLTNYRQLKINLMTHAIAGLSKNDFILAAKINYLPKELKVK